MKTDGNTAKLVKEVSVAVQVKNFLSHYGKKGMRWGQRSTSTPSVTVKTRRKNKVRTKGGEGVPISKDAVAKVTVARVKKKSGVHAVSDKDLKSYANRLELEQRVNRLESQSRSPVRRFVSNLLVNTGKNAAQQAANDAASKQVKKIMDNEGKKK